MKFKIELSQNGWEYISFAFVEANNLTRHKSELSDYIVADGVKITFDEEIGDVFDYEGNIIPCLTKSGEQFE